MPDALAGEADAGADAEPPAAALLEACAAGDDEAGAGDDDELHPAISAAAAAIATAPVAMRARLSQIMVLNRSFDRKAVGATLHPAFLM